MNYELRQFNTPLLRFSIIEDGNSPDVDIVWINEDCKYLLPLDLHLSNEGLAKWLKYRTIPKNRLYVHNFLSKCGLNANRPMNIIKVSKGLSLTDCYWIVEEDFEGTFEKYNLYDNKFSEILAYIAFTGYGSSDRRSLASSPEFTTNGMLPKCWRRISGVIKLYKGGTEGADNMGKEPYSEYYASQIAKIMGINAIEYNISKWKGRLCSTCDLFTSKDYSYIPVGKLVTAGNINAVRAYYSELGQEFIDALDDMIVLDALLWNVDRHFGNFGVLVDNHENKIVSPAPLFDHGNSLFNFAAKYDFESADRLSEYVNSLMPFAYDDFMGMAKSVLSKRHKEGLRHLLNFRFKRHSRYNLPPKHLKLIEKMVQQRARKLLES